MNCNTTHYRANSSSVPGDPTHAHAELETQFRERTANLTTAEKALEERTALASLSASVAGELIQQDTLRGMLQGCTEAIVRQLNASFARIWTLDEKANVLELQASAGMYTRLDGPHGRVPVGQLEIGQIARERRPHLTNSVGEDRDVGDQEWAEREKMVAFAGYPLLVEDRLVGVVAMFASHEFPDFVMKGLGSVANQIAVGIERKLAEELLRESEERLHHLVSSNPAVIYSLEFRGGALVPTWISENVTQLTGYEPNDSFVPGWWHQHVHPDDRDRILAEHAAPFPDHLLTEYRFRCRDGSYLWIRDEKVLLKDATDAPIEVVGSWSDITARREAEWQLSIQHAISRVLAESSTLKQALVRTLETVCENLEWDIGEFWSVDRRAGVMRLDEMWTAPDVQADEFVALSRKMTFTRGTGLPGRVWASGRAAWIADVLLDGNFPRGPAARKAGLHGAFSFPIVSGNDVDGVIEFFSRDVREPDEGLLNMFAVLGSQLGQAFERKRLEDQLVQSQRMEMVGRLSGGIAHEFNSIMTAIIGQSEFMLSDLPSGSPLARNAQQIRKAADRAATLTRQLLAYGRKQILQPEILDLNSVLGGMSAMLQHVTGGEVEVRILPAAGLEKVKADAGQIEQVIMNMAVNARDAMPNGGSLVLETSNITIHPDSIGAHPEVPPGDYVMLAITDTGTGMSDEAKKRAFEPFFTTKGVGKGTGLGLATCHGIVKQSDGHISLYSEVGRGTTFKIYLPQTREQAKAPAVPRATSELPRGTETILLVEDDPALREMAAALLRRLGYVVWAAADGVEALSLTHREDTGHIDLLFTDVVMPHMSGKELSDRIRALRPHTTVLFSSAFTENAIVYQGVLDEGVALLQKPFTPSALAFKVREVLNVGNRP